MSVGDRAFLAGLSVLSGVCVRDTPRPFYGIFRGGLPRPVGIGLNATFTGRGNRMTDASEIRVFQLPVLRGGV